MTPHKTPSKGKHIHDLMRKKRENGNKIERRKKTKTSKKREKKTRRRRATDQMQKSNYQGILRQGYIQP
jgi:hypothetical protein